MVDAVRTDWVEGLMDVPGVAGWSHEAVQGGVAQRVRHVSAGDHRQHLRVEKEVKWLEIGGNG